MNIRKAVKTFYDDNKTEVAFVAGVLAASIVLATIQAKQLNGMKNVGVSEYLNNKTSDHLIVVQQLNGHMDSFVLHPIEDKLVS